MYTIGLASIEIGAIASDGGMGQSLAQLGLTYQDTCKMTTEDPETTDFYAEEVDDPVFSMSRSGKTTFAFSIMNPELTTLQATMGGTITGAGETAKWSPPDTMPIIEQSVRITPQQGLKYEIPRMKIVAKINAEFSKKALLLIEVVGTVLQPTKAGLKKYEASKVATA
ncbi:MAG: hypothetical protein EZS26_000731 [Candidatus Ordinivivax streblomastigis]|uniref:Uncharacterized protein n=1 Tax=Candidatus Ordinivivax streblomastigis TaxID=2540710 RepID=A0A5M8P419_9BACT|nr:MAG: hypothetical protein EZS26_000731 [Candidatus Ordinivivax streblomastigis]